MKKMAAVLALSMLGMSAMAQNVAGTIVTLTGNAEIKADNDEAVVNFFIEEQDKDKTQAASRVNQKMKAGSDTLKQSDPQAELRTRGYYTYPVYSDENAVAGSAKRRQIVAWRTGQYLELKTKNLEGLSSTVAAAQKILAVNGINFGLSEAKLKKIEADRIAAGYKNFTEKLQAITQAMGKRIEDVTIESLSFDGAAMEVQERAAPMMMKAMAADARVAEPSFEPGFSQQSIQVTGKVRLK